MIITIKLLTSTFIKWTRQNDDGQDNQEEQEKVEFHFHFVFFSLFYKNGGRNWKNRCSYIDKFNGIKVKGHNDKLVLTKSSRVVTTDLVPMKILKEPENRNFNDFYHTNH